MILSGFFFLSSCNKALEEFAVIPTPVYPTGLGIAATIAANPNDSLYSRLIVRSGLTATLNDLTKTYTIFAVDNAGMKLFVTGASGGLVPPNAPDASFSAFIAGSLPVASAAGIVQYNTIGQKFPFSSFPTIFPNYPLPSLIILDPTQPFARMTISPAKGALTSYVNTTPFTTILDQPAANGIIHHTASVVTPPTATLKTMIAAEPTLSYFRAAIARGDSGAVGLSKFDSLLNYGVTNMTVLAPIDAAMQPVLFGSIYGALLAQGVPAATANTQATALAATPAGFNVLPVTTVKGIVAYHILASLTSSTITPYQPNIRAFSVNFSSTPTFIKTLVNGSVAVHPGVSAQATFTGATVSSLKFTGLGTFPPGGAPFSGTPATAIAMDKHAVNGVYHIINSVLLPQ